MKLRILIADDEPAARYGMSKALRGESHEIAEAADGNAALADIRRRLPHLVFLDLNMPHKDGLTVLRELGPAVGDCDIIIVTANDSIPMAVECMRLGATDYITKPFEVEQLRAIARRTARRIELECRVERLQGELEESRAFGALVGVSRPMRELYQQVTRVAKAPLDVLIRGETGTGKELLARELHRLSPRADGPFVAVNTAAIAEPLIESELFGHVKGAFTGASNDHAGCFESANGGILFLDEVGDMPPGAQAKILRALQERAVQPVGSSHPIPVDVRVVTATHQDLEQSIAEGHFREDLYYRIRGLELRVPALRERREDIALLADFFLDRLESEVRAPVPRCSREAVEALLSHPWPGNVRELEHAVKAAATLVEGQEIRPEDLELRQRDGGEDPGAYLHLPLTEGKARLVETFERRRIRKALEEAGGNISAAARELGIHRQSLQQKMAQLGIEKP